MPTSPAPGKVAFKEGTGGSNGPLGSGHTGHIRAPLHAQSFSLGDGAGMETGDLQIEGETVHCVGFSEGSVHRWDGAWGGTKMLAMGTV